MTQTISNLTHIDLAQLCDVFNQAFANYLVPLQMTESSLTEKICFENVDLSLSAGCFANNRLIGFIMIATGRGQNENYAYNAGTGVLPEYRGQKITQRLYDFIIPQLKKKNIHHHILEVIKDNNPAFKAYCQAGFIITRELVCFKGIVSAPDKNIEIGIREVKLEEVADLSAEWTTIPTWQNSTEALLRSESFKTVGAFLDGSLAGYITFCPANGKVRQFAVKTKFRRKGIAKALFEWAQMEIGEKEMLITYIDCRDLASISFLEKSHLTKFIEAFEMRAVF